MTDPRTMEEIGFYENQSDPICRSGKTTIVYEDDDTMDIFYHEPDFFNPNKPSSQIERVVLPSNFPRKNKTSPPANDPVQQVILSQNGNSGCSKKELEMEIVFEKNTRKPKESSAFAIHAFPALNTELIAESGTNYVGWKASSQAEAKIKANGGRKKKVALKKTLRKSVAEIRAAPKKPKIGSKVVPKSGIQRGANHIENSVKIKNMDLQNICNSNNQRRSGDLKPLIKASPKKPEIKVTYARSRKKRTKIGTFLCETCDSYFQYASTLNNHVANVHKKVLRSLTVPSFRCSFCPCQFGSDLNRTKHVVQFHLYACEFCGLTFGKVECLEAHRTRRHRIGLPRFYCEECSLTFPSSDSFLVHNQTRVHHHRTTFICPAKGCGMTFNSDAERAEHCATHHDGRGPVHLGKLVPSRFEIHTLLKPVPKVQESKTSIAHPPSEAMPPDAAKTKDFELQ